MDSHLPDGFKAEAGNSLAQATGGNVHYHGLSTGQGLAIAAIASLALGVSIMTIINTNNKVEAQNQRVEAAEKQALIAKMRTEGFTRALIAKGIDPYPHLQGEDK